MYSSRGGVCLHAQPPGANLERSTASLDQLLSADSTVNTEFRQLLIELKEAARSLRIMAEWLERHGAWLIRGNEEGR